MSISAKTDENYESRPRVRVYMHHDVGKNSERRGKVTVRAMARMQLRGQEWTDANQGHASIRAGWPARPGG